MKGLDHYTLHARLMPVMVTLFPVGLAFASVFPEEILGWGLLTGAISVCGLTTFLAQFGRDLGQKVQPKLFKAWGGTPTTIALCLDRTWLNKTTVARVRNLLSAEPRCHDLPGSQFDQNADERLDAAISWVREKTRDKDKFPLVYAENVNYGTRRNIYGLKPVGFIVSLASAFFVLLANDMIHPFSTIAFERLLEMQPIAQVSFVMCCCMLIIWAFLITKSWVYLAAKAYAASLVQAVFALCESD